MNILFIVVPYLPETDFVDITSKDRSFKNIPYGVMSISTYLKLKAQNECSVKILDLNLVYSSEIDAYTEKALKSFKPDVVGISLMFDTSYSYLGRISKLIKVYDRDIITLGGGMSATTSYKEMIEEQTDIDAICYSEGENSFLRFIRSEDKMEFLNNDDSFVTRDSLKAGISPVPSKLENLDDTADLDYSLIDIQQYNMREAFSPFASSSDKNRQFFLITSRGCPFKCTFCHFSAHDDKSMRYISIDRIVKHITELVDKYGMNVLTIYDDQLLANKNRAKELFRVIAPFNIRVEMPNGLTAAYIDDEMAMLMKKAGVDSVQIAIESGSQYVSKNLINKPIRLTKIKEIVGYLRKYEIWVQGFFVTGMPGELDEHREETLNFIKETNFDWSSFSLAFPSAGSKLHQLCVEKGYIDKDTSILKLDHSQEYVINNPDYSKQHIIEQSYLMNLDANFVNNFRMSIGDFLTAEKAFKDVLARYPQQAFARYYLRQALIAQGKHKEAEACFETLVNTVDSNPKWLSYFDYFNIDYADTVDLSIKLTKVS